LKVVALLGESLLAAAFSTGKRTTDVTDPNLFSSLKLKFGQDRTKWIESEIDTDFQS
jgi:hypothetical protein